MQTQRNLYNFQVQVRNMVESFYYTTLYTHKSPGMVTIYLFEYNIERQQEIRRTMLIAFYREKQTELSASMQMMLYSAKLK